MKRSGQVALVLMGVTGATAAGAYMLPARPACPAPQPAPVRDIMDLGKPAMQQGVAAPGVQQGAAAPGAQPAMQQQPCRSSGSSNYHGWHWYSHSNSYSSYGRTPTSTSVGFASNSSSLHSGSGSSSSSSSSSSSTARGGFGSTGHATSGGGHAGS
jgi:hypothetical protein